jgi:hypothetical protein
LEEKQRRKRELRGKEETEASRRSRTESEAVDSRDDGDLAVSDGGPVAQSVVGHHIQVGGALHLLDISLKRKQEGNGLTKPTKKERHDTYTAEGEEEKKE